MNDIKNQIVEYIATKEKLDKDRILNILETYSKLSIEYIYSENIKDIKLINKHPVLDSLIGKSRSGIRIHIYGRPSSSKTSLATSIATWYNYKDKMVLWIDSSHYYPDFYIKNNSDKYDTRNIHITRICPALNDFEFLAEMFDLIVIDDTFTLSDNIRDDIGIVGKICSENQCDLLLLTQTRVDIFNYSNDIVPEIRTTDSDVLIYTTRAERIQNTKSWRYSIKLLSSRLGSIRDTVSYVVNEIGLDLPLFITKIAVERSIMLIKGPRIYHKGKSIGYISKINELGYEFVKELEYILEGDKDESIRC